MLRVYLSQNELNDKVGKLGNWYLRVDNLPPIGIDDVAELIKQHNIGQSKGTIVGILKDFVDIIRQQVLMGQPVKIDNLAIFKATVEANALETLYDAENDKAATAALGTLPAGAKTGNAVKTVKLLAQSTGEFTRDELKKDVKFAWTDKTKAEIAAAKGDSSTGSEQGGGSNQGGGTNTGGNSGGNSGGGDNGGSGGFDTGS